jgi:glycogen(starch) synthase
VDVLAGGAPRPRVSAALRILTIGSMYPPHHLGGYEVIWRGCVSDLRQRGHAVRVLASDYRDDTPLADDSDVHRQLRWYWRDHDFPPLGARERLSLERHNRRVLAQHLAEFQPDVVLWFAMGGMSLALMEQVRRAGIAAVGFVADTWMDYAFERDGWQNAWRRRPRLAGLASRLTGVATGVEPGPQAHWLFISEYTRQTSLKERGWTLPSTALAHSGIDPARFVRSDPPPWRDALLYSGRIDPRKGIDTAISALAQLGDEATLTVAGGGDPVHRAELEALADRLGLSDRVRFLGAVDDLPRVYAEADALIFPVVWDEPWGLVPIEAMAVGRPVVATGTGGSGEYLRDGENCLLYPPGDSAALAAALTRLREDPELRGRLVAGGDVTAARYTEEAFNDVVELALLEAAGSG